MPQPLPALASHLLQQAVLLLALVSSCAVSAHDSWLRVLPEQPGNGLLALELGVGSRYPKSEGPTPAGSLAQAGCTDAAGQRFVLAPRGERASGLELRARVGGSTPLACWMELRPFDVELTPALVQVYFDEVRAPAAVRQAWARQLAGGGSFEETYRKVARIELPSPEPGLDLSPLRKPLGFPLELLPSGGAPLRRGAVASFQALSSGRPVAGLAVEFVSRRNPLGIWRETDGEGRISIALPLDGEWLLRATALEPPDAQGQRWRSRFATLTVFVQ